MDKYLELLKENNEKLNKLYDRLYSANGFEGDIPEIKNAIKNIKSDINENRRDINRNKVLVYAILGVLASGGSAAGIVNLVT